MNEEIKSQELNANELKAWLEKNQSLIAVAFEDENGERVVTTDPILCKLVKVRLRELLAKI